MRADATGAFQAGHVRERHTRSGGVDSDTQERPSARDHSTCRLRAVGVRGSACTKPKAESSAILDRSHLMRRPYPCTAKNGDSRQRPAKGDTRTKSPSLVDELDQALRSEGETAAHSTVNQAPAVGATPDRSTSKRLANPEGGERGAIMARPLDREHDKRSADPVRNDARNGPTTGIGGTPPERQQLRETAAKRGAES